MTIPHMRESFNCEVGLSDHTVGFGAAVASIALGGTVVEKHFTLNRDEGGVDSVFSIEPEEMQILVQETKRAWQAVGSVHYGPASEQEKASLQYRRSLYIVKQLEAGAKISQENMRAIRPGFGLPTKYFDTVCGMSVKHRVKPGVPVSWRMFKDYEEEK